MENLQESPIFNGKITLLSGEDVPLNQSNEQGISADEPEGRWATTSDPSVGRTTSTKALAPNHEASMDILRSWKKTCLW